MINSVNPLKRKPFLLLLFVFCLPGFANVFAQNFKVTITGPFSLCNGDCDTLIATASPSSPGDSYAWSTGVTTPTMTVCSPGTYILTVTNQNGATATASYTVQSYTIPVSITSDNKAPCNAPNNPGTQCEKVCPYSKITYSTTGGSQGLEWSVSGAASYTQQNTQVVVQWGPPGNGSINVTGFFQPCLGIGNKCVTIVPEPEAKFRTQPAASGKSLQVCKGQSVYFYNESVSADAIEWSFSDNLEFTTTGNTEHLFQTPGIHTVRLIARSNCLCADTTTMTIEVLDLKAPSLSCVSTVCPGESVLYRVTDGCQPYNWAVSPNGSVLSGGTASSDSIIINWADGMDAGLITLGAQSCGAGCPLATVIRIPVISDQAEIQGPSPVCRNTSEVYRIEAFGGTGFTWSLASGGFIESGQGTNQVSVKWTGSVNNTSHLLSVVYDNCYLGCSGRDTLAVQIQAPLVLSGPLEVCPGLPAVFSSESNSQKVLCNWTLTDPGGNTVWTSPAPTDQPVITFGLTPGLYRLHAVLVNTSQSCEMEADWSVRVAEKPQAPTGIKGETEICPLKSYTYEALGLPADATIKWTIQNGNSIPITNTGNPVNVSWANGSIRTITAQQLSADDLGCLSDPVSTVISSLSLGPITGDKLVCESASGHYSIPKTAGQDIKWETVPATAGSVANGQGTGQAEIFWSQPGVYQVKATACSQTATFTVTVAAKPQPSLVGVAGVCPGKKTTFTTAVPYTYYSWKDAADNLVGTSATVNLGDGDYTLLVTDANGCTESRPFKVDLYPKPNVSLTTADPTAFCNNSYTVTLTALVNQDADFSYSWKRDGVPLPATGPLYATNQYGYYTVQATNSYGCTASADPIQLVEDCQPKCEGFCPSPGEPCSPGDVDMQITPHAACTDFSFKAITGPNIDKSSVEWFMGLSGGKVLSAPTGLNASFSFPNAGKYIVILFGKLPSGKVCVDIDSVFVEAAAQFDPLTNCPGIATSFVDASTHLPGSSITNWQWSFGDPISGGANTSTLTDAAHTFIASGNYPVSLTVTAQSGCTATSSQNIIIPAVTPVNITPPAISCVGNALKFEGNSPALSAISNFSWSFGDPASGASNAASANPSYHKFTNAATYTVSLQTTNTYGCTATTSIPVKVTPPALSGSIIPNNPSPICEGKTLNLTAPNGAVSYAWSDKNTKTRIVTVSTTGVYSVTMTDASGCTYSPAPVSVTVRPAPDAVIKALIKDDLGQTVGLAYPNLATCEGEDVYLQAFAAGSFGYTWSNGAGNNETASFTKFRGNLLSAGNYLYTVTVTDYTTGCTGVASPFNVVVNPQPAAFSVTGTGACAGSPSTISYTGPDPGNAQLVWNTGTTGQTYTTDQAGLYKLRITNSFGCARESAPWEIRPGPPVGNVPAGCHTRCKPDTLCIPTIPNITSWQWYMDGQPLAGSNSPQLVAQQSGTYWAVLTDNTGCTGKTDPLDLKLFDAFGTITGKVWSDVNDNGMVDPADTIISGIAVWLLNNGKPVNFGLSDTKGGFGFVNIPSVTYEAEVELNSLPPNWHPVIGKTTVQLNGCDALKSCNLLLRYYVCPNLNSTLQLNTCSNKPVLYNNMLLQAGSTQNVLVKTAEGCDSTVTVSVVSFPTPNTSLQLVTCPSELVTINNVSLAAGDSHVFTYKTPEGCDSLVTVTVTAQAVPQENLEVSACANAAYTYQGVSILPGSSQTFTLKNPATGCDSLVTVQVATDPIYQQALTLTACANGTATVNGLEIPAGTSHLFSYKTTAGCDSLVSVTVDAYQPTPPTELQVKVCPGEIYFYNGYFIAPGETLEVPLENQWKCDSLVRLSVETWPVPTNALNVSICSGSTYLYNGKNLPVGTVETFSFYNVNTGCDSLVTVSVLEKPVYDQTVTMSTCAGSSVTVNGMDIPAGSSHLFKYTTLGGCDSLINVVVTELPKYSKSIQPTICPGTSFTYDGVDIPAGSSKVFTYKTVNGCDSVVNISVAAYPESPATTENYRVCPGELLSYYNQFIAPGESVQVVLPNQWLCDSIVTVSVEAYKIPHDTLKANVCYGASYLYNGETLFEGDIKTYILYNPNTGCDSVVTVSVQSRPIPTDTLYASVCSGSSYNYQGKFINAGDTQSFLLYNPATGCDSLVTVIVDALPMPQDTIQAGACAGKTYNYQGLEIFSGSTQTITLKDPVSGCESLRTITVESWPIRYTALKAGVCPGEVFTYQGSALKPGDQQEFKLKTLAHGCDSIVNVKVEQFPAYSDTVEVTVCPNEKYNFNGQDINPGETKFFNLKSFEKCDSTITIRVKAYPALSFKTVTQPSCANYPAGKLQITDPKGAPGPYLYSLDGQNLKTEPVFSPLSAGSYTAYVEDGNGCQSVQTVVVNARAALKAELPKAVLPCDAQSIELAPKVSGDLTELTYSWWNQANTSSMSITEPGAYWVDIQNVCESLRLTALVEYGELGTDLSLIYLPNAIAPEAVEARNAIFKPFFPASVTVEDYQMEVYDRWGSLLFHTEQLENGWNGLHRSKMLDPGVYVWHLTAKVSVCGRAFKIDRKGDVTIVR